MNFYNVLRNEYEGVTHFERLFTKYLQDSGYSVKEYTGVPPFTINANGEPLIDWAIYGNLSQSGTPTPSSPIYPSECGERTENVMPSAPAETKTKNGITVTCDGNGVYTLSGTSIDGSVVIFSIPEFQIPISVGQGGQGTMSLFNTLPNDLISLAYINNGTTIDAWSINSANRKNNAYSTMSGKICNAIQFYVPDGNNCDCIIKPCFTNDSIYPTTYIPYGYKLPLTLGSTTTDIYLGEVQTTRRIKKLVLTGAEEVRAHQSIVSWFQIFLTDIVIDGLELCTHYKPSPYMPANMQNGEIFVGKQTAYDEGRVVIKDSAYTTADDFKSYLQQQYAAGTPVTVWYVLANPTTGIVNEPIRKIGDYVDSVSNVISIPTIKGVQTLDVGTTLKPSDVYVKYYGK